MKDFLLALNFGKKLIVMTQEYIEYRSDDSQKKTKTKKNPFLRNSVI